MDDAKYRGCRSGTLMISREWSNRILLGHERSTERLTTATKQQQHMVQYKVWP